MLLSPSIRCHASVPCNSAWCIGSSSTTLSCGRPDQGFPGRSQMRSASEFDHGAIAAEESFDIGQVFPDRDLVTLPFIAFVPLIVVVKNQRDDVVKVVDEPVGPGRIDETVKPVVEVGKIVIAPIDLVQQREMLLAQRLDLPPSGELSGSAAKAVADRSSNISRISNSSSAKLVVKPLKTNPAFGRLSMRPKRWKRFRNSRMLVVATPNWRASSSSLMGLLLELAIAENITLPNLNAEIKRAE